VGGLPRVEGRGGCQVEHGRCRGHPAAVGAGGPVSVTAGSTPTTPTTHVGFPPGSRRRVPTSPAEDTADRTCRHAPAAAGPPGIHRARIGDWYVLAADGVHRYVARGPE